MINSLTNHMELFDFTVRNKSRILRTWKDREMGSIESLTAPFTLDQLLNTRFQLQLHTLLPPSIATTNLKLHLFSPETRLCTYTHTRHDYRLMLVIGFALQIYNVNTGLNCEYKFACTYNEVSTPPYRKNSNFQHCLCAGWLIFS